MGRTPADQRQLRVQRKLLGMCSRCGKNPPRDGKVDCQECGEKQHRRYESWRDRHPGVTRMKSLRNKHHVTQRELDELLAQQHCAICGTTERLHIDHCHITGKIRERLCRSCNLALGYLRDSPELFRKAATYLEEHGKVN